MKEMDIIKRTQHNVHHFMQFMWNARQSIANNEFDRFYEDFTKNCCEQSLYTLCLDTLHLLFLISFKQTHLF